MKNKIIFFLLMFGLVFGLAACGKNKNVTTISKSEILAANLEPEEHFEPEFSIESLEIPSNYDIQTSYLSQGFLIAIDEDDYSKQMVYSLYTKKLIFGPRENTYTTTIYSGTLYFLHVFLDDLGVYRLYDVFGNFLIEIPFDNYYMSYEMFYHYDDEGELIGHYQALYLEYYFYDDIEDDYYYKYTEFYIDIFNRKLVTKEEAEIDYFSSKPLEKMDLKEFGLPGYYITFGEGEEFNIYNDKDKLINTLFIATGEPMAFFDGHALIYNLSEVLLESDTNYTYIDSYGDRYLEWIERIDILTGNKVELKLDYAILDIMPLKDKNDKIVYAMAEIKYINNKRLDDRSQIVVINKDGEIVTHFNRLDIMDLHPLHNNHYYSYDSDIFYNENFEPLFRIPYFVDGVPGYERIIFGYYSGSMGMIDYEGSVLVEPTYDYIEVFFSKGWTIGYKDSKVYLISLDGSESELESSTQLITTGLLYNQTEDVELHDYAFNTLLKITDATQPYNNTWQLDNLMTENIYKIKYFVKSDGTKVIVSITY